MDSGVSEFDEKLNALLSNPDSMAQIMQLAQSLNGSSGTAQQQSGPTQSPPQQTRDQSAQGQSPYQAPPAPQGQTPFQSQAAAQSPPPSLSDLLTSFTGGADPKLLLRLLPLLKELNGTQDTQARQLLYALRPYLKAQRQEKVERALQLARLIHLGKKFLSGWEG